MDSHSQYLLENIKEFLLNQLDNDSINYAENPKLITIDKKSFRISKKINFLV